MFFWRLKESIRGYFAVALAILAGCFVWGMGSTRFSALTGTRAYYSSASSQAERKSELSYLDIARVKGESVTLSKEISVEELLASYEAELCFIEEAGGVTSYYAVSPKWSDGIVVNGEFVNLHIAVAENRTAVGAPIIFGGF